MVVVGRRRGEVGSEEESEGESDEGEEGSEEVVRGGAVVRPMCTVRDCAWLCVAATSSREERPRASILPIISSSYVAAARSLLAMGAVRHVVKAKVEGDQVPLDGRLRLRHEPPVKARDARSRVARPAVADVPGAVLDLGHAASAEDLGHATYVADRDAVSDDEDVWHRGRRGQAGAHLTAERVAWEDRA